MTATRFLPRSTASFFTLSSVGFRLVTGVVALALSACGDGEPTGRDEAASDEGALATAALPAGLYFLEGEVPSNDAVEGLRVGAGGKGALLHSWRGSPSRVRESCAVTAKVKAPRTLELRCPSGPVEPYTLLASEGRALMLRNASGETLKLAKVDPSFAGDALYHCDADTFTARIAVEGVDGGRRALVTIRRKAGDAFGTPPEETFWLRGDATLAGVDIWENEYDLSLARRLGPSFDAELGFVDTTTPLQLYRRGRALRCTAR